jgi:hypothetical protein
VQSDGLTEFLVGLVSENIASQPESDEISGWFNVRPTETLEKFRSQFGPHGHGGHGGHHGRFGRGRGGFRGFPPRFGEPAPAPSTEGGAATDASIVYY